MGSQDLVAGVLKDVETSQLSESEKTLFRFVKKVNCDSVSIGPPDIEALSEPTAGGRLGGVTPVLGAPVPVMGGGAAGNTGVAPKTTAGLLPTAAA